MPAPRFGKPRAHKGSHSHTGRVLKCDGSPTPTWWKRGTAYCWTCRHPIPLELAAKSLARLEETIQYVIAEHSHTVADDFDDSERGITALIGHIEGDHPSIRIKGEEQRKLLWTITDLMHKIALLDNPIHMPAISGLAAGNGFGVRTAWAREYDRRIKQAVSDLTKAATS